MSGKIKLFVSSTIKDLKKNRSYLAAVTALGNNFDPVLAEGFFGTSIEGNPVERSLNELKLCDAFLGIIGLRYGTIFFGYDKSTTHLEFDLALRLMKSKRLPVVLLEARSLLISTDDIEEPERLREKKREWVQQIYKQITPKQFNDDDFSPRLFTALNDIRTAVEKAGEPPDPLIRPAEVEKVFRAADLEHGHSIESRITRIVDSVATQLGTLFSKTDEFVENSPFFQNIRQELERNVTDIDYQPETSSLWRAGIRHVLVRVNTFVAILEKLAPQQRHSVGVKIGLGASRDFWKNVPPINRIFDSLETLFQALNYWDQTGGWGHITVSKPLREIGQTRQEVEVRVSNHFLVIQGDIAATHELCGFWEGYILGFLTHSLIQVDRMRDLKSELRPAKYPHLSVPISVEHEPDDDNNEDRFIVTFESRRDAGSREEIYLALQDCDNGQPTAAKGRLEKVLTTLTQLHGIDATKDLAAILEAIKTSHATTLDPRAGAVKFMEECDRLLEVSLEDRK